MKPAPLKILVVDDEDFVREFHALSLIRAGFSVTWASDGVEAMTWLDSDRFDAVVNDIVMPHMGGLKLLQTVGKCHPELPVILVSGSAHSDTVELAKAWGAVAVLEKPVNAAKLAAIVQSACNDDPPFLPTDEINASELAALQV